MILTSTDAEIGTVRSFRTDRGFGFIVPDGGGEDVFVHTYELEAAGIRKLIAGARVEFVRVRDGGRWQARRLALVTA
jgi:CspA family cold shock protein